MHGVTICSFRCNELRHSVRTYDLPFHGVPVISIMTVISLLIALDDLNLSSVGVIISLSTFLFPIIPVRVLFLSFVHISGPKRALP